MLKLCLMYGECSNQTAADGVSELLITEIRLCAIISEVRDQTVSDNSLIVVVAQAHCTSLVMRTAENDAYSTWQAGIDYLELVHVLRLNAYAPK